ncbi:efflux RND transporter periplasmic adaptor subunit [Flavobacterium sp. I3-2]|uniref:efflux RND transporter periplasmic adaptor subunit n=1 Tax=Flavobacterium sp. I3-2 TaxID=2748319 RepID=UPI0015B20B96|nr:efflux RND transporter periplasmic adaptor subunit [Flavobacterium sp. I3-2]
MKKIISSLFILSFLFLSCSDKEKESKSIENSQEKISTVVGIGKVLPKNGIIPLSISQTNQVVALYKKMGDTVQAGELIFKMKAVSENLDVQLAKSSLQATLDKNKASAVDYEIEQIKLNELKQLFLTSKKLYNQKAETKQKVYLDSIAYVQQLQKVNQSKLNKVANNELMNEKEVQLKTALNKLNEQEFRALQSGILIRFDVALGQVLTANSIFGELAELSDLVIEGEVDELYASDIKTGQEVEIYLVGQNTMIAKGTISFAASSLQNKSIIYETIGEGSDRRVRRFTVAISNENKSLLINQKVECKIKI